MRPTIDEFDIDEISVTVAFDSGGAVGGEYIVEVTGNDWEVTRWFYFDEFGEEAVTRFAERLATDAEFREASKNKSADWAVTSERYEKTAEEIYEQFATKGLLSHRVGNRAEERVYGQAVDRMESLCQDAFTQIKANVYEGTPLTLAGKEVTFRDFVAGYIEKANSETETFLE